MKIYSSGHFGKSVALLLHFFFGGGVGGGGLKRYSEKKIGLSLVLLSGYSPQTFRLKTALVRINRPTQKYNCLAFKAPDLSWPVKR